MLVYLNGRFVQGDRAVISVFDRSFLYGDGLFETMRVANGKPFRWGQHLQRLRRGAAFLKIKLPFGPTRLRRAAGELIAKNKMPEALLRLTLSRGVGLRGYSPKGANRPTLVMSLHPAPGTPISRSARSSETRFRTERKIGAPPPRWKLITSSFRLPAGEPLAQFKSCNKLPQILARAEADAAGADEALLLNTDGFVVEGASSNLFWITGETVCTPPLASGILAGVTRQAVVEIARSLGLRCSERNITVPALERAGAVFVTLSSWGVVGARSLDGSAFADSRLVRRLQLAYDELVRAETRQDAASP